MQELIGKQIVNVRQMTQEEMDANMWYGNERPPVLMLDDGTELFPSCDPEGNGAGALFGSDEQGDFIVL